MLRPVVKVLILEENKELNIFEGRQVDAHFIHKFIEACGVESFNKCRGKRIWVTYRILKDGEINLFKVEPFSQRQGKPFDIEEWQRDWTQERLTKFKECYPSYLCWR